MPCGIRVTCQIQLSVQPSVCKSANIFNIERARAEQDGTYNDDHGIDHAQRKLNPIVQMRWRSLCKMAAAWAKTELIEKENW